MNIKKNPLKKPVLVGLDYFDSRPGGLGRAFDHICTRFNDGNFIRLEIGLEEHSKKVSPESSLISRMIWLTQQSLKIRKTTSYIFSHFALHGFVVSLFVKEPLFSFFHGPWANESSTENPTKKATLRFKFIIERYIYRKSIKIFCASENFKNLLHAQYGIPSEKIYVVPLGVDFQRFKPGSKTEARKNLKLDDSEIVFVSVRRLTKRMGLADLVDAFSILLEIHPRSRLYLIGRGSEKLELEKQIQRNKLVHRVLILNDVPDDVLPQWYQAADLSIVPSVALEGFGLVVLESLACGTPVIATRCGGLHEIVRKWNPNFLVDPNRPLELAEKLIDFAKGQLTSNRNDNYEYAGKFSWDTCVEKLQDEIGKKTITYVSTESLVSGAELSLLELVSTLNLKLDQRVILGGRGELFSLFKEKGIQVSIDSRILIDFNKSVSLLKLLKVICDWIYRSIFTFFKFRSDKSDIVFINTFKTLLLLSPFVKFTKTRVIFWAHDSFEINHNSDIFKNLFYKFIFSSPNLTILCNSQYTSNTLQRVSKNKSTHVLYPIFKLNATKFVKPSKDATLVGISGRISNWKGQLFAMKALLPLFDTFPGLSLEILGSPLFNERAYYQELQNFIAKNNLLDKVKLTPFVSNPKEHVSKWDLSILSSIEAEPFGRVVVDSIGAGVPILIPNYGGPAEMLGPEGSKFMYEFRSEASLRNKVSEFFSKSYVREEMLNSLPTIWNRLLEIESNNKFLDLLEADFAQS